MGIRLLWIDDWDDCGPTNGGDAAVYLSIVRYGVFTWLPPVLVTLVELASVYHTALPGFAVKSTGNEQVIDRGYNEKKKMAVMG